MRSINNCNILKQDEVIKIKGYSHITSGVRDNIQPLSCQSKRRASYTAENLPSIFYTRSDKGKSLIAFGSTNILTEHNIYRGKDVIRLNK